MPVKVPDGWSLKTLSSLCSEGLFTDGDWIESKDQDPNGEIRLIQLSDIGDGIFINKTNRFINEETGKSLNVTFLHRGDIVIARMPDPIGRSCIFPLDQKAITAVDVCIVRPRVGVDRIWLMNAINSPYVRMMISKQATGTTRQRISRSNLGNIEIAVPPHPEQCRIAEILSSVDEAIAATQTAIDQTRTLRQGVLKHLLTKGIGHTRFKKTEFGDIPEEWHIVEIGEIAVKESGILTGPFGTALSEADFVDSGIPVLRIGNIRESYVDSEKLLYVTEEKANSLSRYRVQDRDILFARQGATTGRNCLAKQDHAGWLINYHIIRLRIDQEITDPRHTYYCLNSNITSSQLDANKSKGNRDGINCGQISSFRIPLPTLAESRKISDILDSFVESENSSWRKKRELMTLKSALMSDLLTGQKRVQPTAIAAE